MENWRPINGWPKYEVSDLGRVRRNDKPLKLTWTGPSGRQYLVCTLSDGKRKRVFRAHFLVAHTFLGEKPKGKQTAHLDGDRSNNRLDNLCYVTPSENNLHKREHGTMCQGERHHKSVLTESAVLDILSRARRGHPVNSYASLARQYGVTCQQIRNVVNRTSWRHVTTPETKQEQPA